MSDPTTAEFDELEQRHRAAQQQYHNAMTHEPPAKRPRNQHPQAQAPGKEPKPSAGLYHYGIALTVVAAIAGFIGGTGVGAEGALVVAIPLGLVGPIMIVIATYRAMSSIDYLARERFRDPNG